MNSPIETLYVNNLPDKLDKKELKRYGKKTKQTALIYIIKKHNTHRALYYLFSQYGPIVDIVAMKTLRTRGQAFIAFRDVAVAQAALTGLQGFNFYNKSISVAFAKVKSESVAKLDGTFRKRSAKEKQQDSLKKDKAFLIKIKSGNNALAKRPAEETSAVKKIKAET